MKINLIVRLKNKNFWLTFIPALLLLIQTVAATLGFELDLGDIGNKLLTIVEAVFLVLGILGIINDPTTAGLSDSTRALTYKTPNKE